MFGLESEPDQLVNEIVLVLIVLSLFFIISRSFCLIFILPKNTSFIYITWYPRLTSFQDEYDSGIIQGSKREMKILMELTPKPIVLASFLSLSKKHVPKSSHQE